MKLIKCSMIAALAMVPGWAGGIYYGGVEDLGTPGGYEMNGDYNDMIFSFQGSGLSLSGSGTWRANPAVNETGSTFWDHKSLDGPMMNAGYCLYGGGDCKLPGGPISNLDYWAGPNGGQVLNDVFTAGGTITATLLAKITAYYTTDELGWFNPADPEHTLHVIFDGTLTPGHTVTFTPTSNFVLWTDHGSDTPKFYSDTVAGGAETGQSHFAFFSTPGQSQAPEPGTLATVIPGLLLMGAGLRRLRK